VDRFRVFEIASILAAIAVPTFGIVANTDILMGDKLLLNTIALAGILFLVTALFSLFDLMEVRRIPSMRVVDALREYISSRGALLAGLICLFIFQIAQTFIFL